MVNKNKRRSFLKAAITLSGASVAAPVFSLPLQPKPVSNRLKENYTILFQGDSITDGNRTRNNDWNHIMGHGYAYIIASKLWYQFPETKFKIYNRGVSGDKITDLEKRWEEDTMALKPDLLSILVGINDISVFINGDKTFTPAQYEEKCRGLLEATKTKFPSVQFVLCEPFILPVGNVKNKLDVFKEEVTKRQEVVKKLAKDFEAIHIAFQQAFDNMLTKAPADYWIWDGIHPMPAGHELMALQWMKLVGEKLGVNFLG